MDQSMTEPEIEILIKYQDRVQKIDQNVPADIDPKKHHYFRKQIMQFRDELRDGHSEFVKVRRAKLKRLLILDMVEHVQSMRSLGYDLMPTFL